MPKQFKEYDRVNQWDLPEIIDPERICVCFEIPNERYHIRAFWTALYKLSLWNSWAADDDKTGTKVAAVWRDVWNKAIGDNNTVGCGCREPIATRINEDGILEADYGDGDGFQPAPELDPRLSNPTIPPLPNIPGQDMKCIYAANMVQFFQSAEATTITNMGVGTGLTGLVAVLLSIVAVALGSTGVGLPLSALLMGLAAALLQAGASGFDAAMTEDVYERLLCTFYCNIADDGSVTEAAWQGIKAQIREDEEGIAERFLVDNVNLLGVVGLTNAARSGTAATADCTECTCDNGCSDKYQVYGNDPNNGIIVDRGPNYIDVTTAASGYCTLEAINYNDCCYVTGGEIIEGEGIFFSAFELCGAPPSPPWIPNTPIGNCCSIIELQATAFGIFRIYFDVCP